MAINEAYTELLQESLAIEEEDEAKKFDLWAQI